MSKRYPTVNTLGDQTPMPLLGWLTRELDINQYDMRCVSVLLCMLVCMRFYCRHRSSSRSSSSSSSSGSSGRSVTKLHGKAHTKFATLLSECEEGGLRLTVNRTGERIKFCSTLFLASSPRKKHGVATRPRLWRPHALRTSQTTGTKLHGDE